MFKASIKLPEFFKESDASLLNEELGHDAFAAWRKDSQCTLEWLFTEKPDQNHFKAQLLANAKRHGVAFDIPEEITLEPVVDQDWLSESYTAFDPLCISPFLIYDRHQNPPIPDDLMGVAVDASTAFGSGEHETTAACLAAMAALNDQGLCPWNILDMGTGSGILTIAAWRLWHAPVMAVDCDLRSIVLAQENVTANDIRIAPGSVQILQSNGFDAPDIAQKGPYELITANILAGHLCDMARDLCAVLDDNGYAVLSGILNAQAERVIRTYTEQGLTLKEHIEGSEWSTLVMQRISV